VRWSGRTDDGSARGSGLIFAGLTTRDGTRTAELVIER
jgi:hypothetical protein